MLYTHNMICHVLISCAISSIYKAIEQEPPPPLPPVDTREATTVAPPTAVDRSTAARFRSMGGTTSRVVASASASTSEVSSCSRTSTSTTVAAARVDLNANTQFVQGQNGRHRVVSINNDRKWVNADNLSVFGGGAAKNNTVVPKNSNG